MSTGNSKKKIEKVKKKHYTKLLDPVSGSLKVEVLKDRSAGRASLHVTYTYQKPGEWTRTTLRRILEFPVVSAWVNPLTNNIIKLHMSVPRNRWQQNLAGFILDETGVSLGGRNMQLTTNRSMTCIRYGCDRVFTDNDDSDNYKPYFIYNTKSALINLIIEHTDRFISVGGRELANFQNVPDALVADLGFIEVKDEMRRAPSMWLGNVDSLIGGGSDGSYYGEQTIRTANVKSFLELLAQQISA